MEDPPPPYSIIDRFKPMIVMCMKPNWITTSLVLLELTLVVLSGISLSYDCQYEIKVILAMCILFTIFRFICMIIQGLHDNGFLIGVTIFRLVLTTILGVSTFIKPFYDLIPNVTVMGWFSSGFLAALHLYFYEQ